MLKITASNEVFVEFILFVYELFFQLSRKEAEKSDGQGFVDLTGHVYGLLDKGIWCVYVCSGLIWPGALRLAEKQVLFYYRENDSASPLLCSCEAD